MPRATRPRPFTRTWMAAALTALVAGACGDAEPRRTPIPHPEGGQVVVEVRTVGGFRLVDAGLREPPQAVLLGDGRMIVEGPQIEIYPPPALPALLLYVLSADGLQTVLEEARAAGLLSPPGDYGRPPLADALTTVITLQAGGETYEHRIYALSETRDGTGLTAAQQQARRAAAGFVSELGAPEALVEDESDARASGPFQAQAFAIRATPVASGEPDLGEMEAEVVDWPLDEVRLDGSQPCQLVLAAHADRLRQILAGATTLTRFRQDGATFRLDVRPLLPHEDRCEAVLPATAME